MQNINRQKGAGLIEILVALLILTIGVLGFIGMQVKALSSTTESFNRAQATILAAEIAAHMTQNSRRLIFISSETTQQAYQDEIDRREKIFARYLGGNESPGLEQCLGFASDGGPKCSELKIVDWDLQLSERDVKALLPGGEFKITKTGTSTETFTVEVGWASKKETDNAAEECETDTASCVRLEVIP